MKESSAHQLTSLANDWQEGEEAKEITEKKISKRIKLQSLTVTSGGSFTAYYNDDDMFWGHAIEVDGTFEKE